LSRQWTAASIPKRRSTKIRACCEQLSYDNAITIAEATGKPLPGFRVAWVKEKKPGVDPGPGWVDAPAEWQKDGVVHPWWWVNAEKMATLQRMVDLADYDGCGGIVIAEKLATGGFLPLRAHWKYIRGRKYVWRGNTVLRELRSKSLIGHYLPHKQEGDRWLQNDKLPDVRQPAIDNPWEHYFPTVVSPDKFWSVQAKLDSRAQGPQKQSQPRNFRPRRSPRCDRSRPGR
jgi:Recombinase